MRNCCSSFPSMLRVSAFNRFRTACTLCAGAFITRVRNVYFIIKNLLYLGSSFAYSFFLIWLLTPLLTILPAISKE